jgi:hypothetical protein
VLAVLRRLLTRKRPVDPEALKAAEAARFEQETLKQGAFSAPAPLQGQKFPTEW